MDVDARNRNIIFSVGIIIVSLYILLYGYPIYSLIPILLTIPIYIFGVSFGRVHGSLFLSSLIMVYMVLEGIHIYYLGVLFAILALIYEPSRGINEHRVVYLILGISILMASYITIVFRLMGLPSLYRFIYLVWGGILIVAWIYIVSAPKDISFIDITRFRRLYQRLFSRPMIIGMISIYLLLLGVAVLSGYLLGLIISVMGLYLIYRRVYSLYITGLLLFLYIMLSIFFGVENAFTELEALIRTVGGWFG